MGLDQHKVPFLFLLFSFLQSLQLHGKLLGVRVEQTLLVLHDSKTLYCTEASGQPLDNVILLSSPPIPVLCGTQGRYTVQCNNVYPLKKKNA